MKVFLFTVFLLVPSFLFASENLYKEKWCKDKRGKIDQVVSGVVIDCVTKSYAVKVSKLTTWQDLIGKAEAIRSAVPGKRTGIVVIYDKSKAVEFRQFKAVAEARGVTVWNLKSYYLKSKPQARKVVKVSEPKKKTSSKRSYFTPKRRKVIPLKPSTSRRPIVTKTPGGTITTTTRIVVKEKIIQEERALSPQREVYKPWLGDGFVDHLR